MDAQLFPMYPLVNVYITMERPTILQLGKSTISMVITTYNYGNRHVQRVNPL